MEKDVHAVILTIELYLVVIAVDVLIAWVQEDPRRWPRRLTHALTEPLQVPLRAVLKKVRPDGLDWSPLVVVALLGVLRVILVRS